MNMVEDLISTIVEIIKGLQTAETMGKLQAIYNSRNYKRPSN